MMRTNIHHLRREQGSVYILALLVLLILTVVGLSLSLVTQSEMQIGVNERLSHQAFHMSTAGIDIATAKIHTLKNRVKDMFLIEKNGNFCHNVDTITDKLTGNK